MGKFAVIAAAGLAAAAHGQLVVNQNLGTIGAGTFNIAASTGANNANYYEGVSNPTLIWTGEYVVQFTTTSSFVFDLAFNFESSDTDTFLLNGLSVVGGAAQDALAAAFLDFGPESYGLRPAGTYYLSIETFGGSGGSPLTSSFDLDLTLAALAPPASFIDLGTVADEGEAFSIDTFGSTFDTELGLYDNDGLLLGNNDDTGGLQSELVLNSGLAEGTYWFAVGGFNTGFSDGWLVSPGTSSGTIAGQINGVSLSGSLASGQIQWYRFNVIPAPASLALLGLGGLAAARRRR